MEENAPLLAVQRNRGGDDELDDGTRASVWRTRAVNAAFVIACLGGACLFGSYASAGGRGGDLWDVTLPLPSSSRGSGGGRPAGATDGGGGGAPALGEENTPVTDGDGGGDLGDGGGGAGITLATLTCPDAVCGAGTSEREKATLQKWCGVQSITTILVHADDPAAVAADYAPACPEKIKVLPGDGCNRRGGDDEEGGGEGGGDDDDGGGGVSMKCFFDSFLSYANDANNPPSEAFAFANADCAIEGLDKAFAYLSQLNVGPYLALIRRTDVAEGGAERLHPGYGIDFFLTNKLIAPFGEDEDDFVAGKPIWDNLLVGRYWKAGHLGLELTGPSVKLLHEEAERREARDDPAYVDQIHAKYGAGAYVAGGVHAADAVLDCSTPQCFLRQRDHPHLDGQEQEGAEGAGTPVVDAVAARVALRARGEENFVIAVALTDGYIKMFSNMLCSARRTGTNNMMVLAFDMTSYNYAMENGVPVVYALPPEGVDAEDKYLSIGFQRIMLYRLKMLRAIVQSGINVVTMDADVVPMAPSFTSVVDGYFGAYQMFGQANDKGQADSGHISGGFIGVKANRQGAELLGRVIDCQVGNIQVLVESSQNGQTYSESAYSDHTEQECFQKEFNALDADARLSVTQIMDGYEYFEQHVAFDQNTHIALHHNYVIGAGEKIKRMQDNNLWTVDETLQCVAQLGATPDVVTEVLGDERRRPSAQLGQQMDLGQQMGQPSSSLASAVHAATMLTFYVLTNGRNEELRQTLDSIEKVTFPAVSPVGNQVDVEIRVDATTPDGAAEAVEQMAREMDERYSRGSVRVVRDAHVGLTRAWMNVPSWQSRWAIVVEDDISLSPDVLTPLFSYKEVMLSDDRIFGFTNQFQSTKLGRLLTPQGEGDDPLLPCDVTVAYQLMSTWAPLIKMSAWRDFRHWMYNVDMMDKGDDPDFLRQACTPGLMTNSYVVQNAAGPDRVTHIWSEWAQRYLVDHGKVMLHHQFCGEKGEPTGFAVHRAADGLHFHEDTVGRESSGLVQGVDSLPAVTPDQIRYFDILLRPSSPQALDDMSVSVRDRRATSDDPCAEAADF